MQGILRAPGPDRRLCSPRASRKTSAGESGFTLLEVLVSVGLMSLVAAVLLQVMTVGLRVQRTSLEQSQAMEAAQQVLREYQREAALTPGTFQGSEGPYRYQVTITPQYQVIGQQSDAAIVTCYLLTVQLSYASKGRLKTLELDTFKVAAPNPGPRAPGAGGPRRSVPGGRGPAQGI